ncbi:MAG: hypothetical protein GY708_05560 [Actinomycetia bacterium]|nr:hypothetical protein [Actinomycetes bacterium]
MFREWWAEFILMRVGVRPSTRLRDESIFRCHLEPVFGDVPIDQIGFRDAQRFVADLTTTDLSPRTVRKAAGLLAQCLDIASPSCSCNNEGSNARRREDPPSNPSVPDRAD